MSEETKKLSGAAISREEKMKAEEAGVIWKAGGDAEASSGIGIEKDD